ncbi:MAG: thiamine phosphate synthase [Geminicoccaceae bacterium]|nr:thiamine phosphate synthase [Geminicoccaceae bacterium]
MKPALDLRLYGIIDPARTRNRDPVGLVRAALAGGITLLQLRDKHAGTRDFVDMARALHDVCGPAGVPLLINDRVDVALAAGVEGVHVGQSDMRVGDARRLLGPDALIGLTVDCADDAREAANGEVDYAGIGPVYATRSKDDADPAIGPQGLRERLTHLRGVPCCGIGGITHGNAARVIEAGAGGVSVISDIFMADDVEASARRLRRIVEDALS